MMTQLRNQAPRGRREEASWQEMAAGVALTLFFHGLILVTAVFSTWCAGAEEEPTETVEVAFDDVELLALGEEPDPHALPRLTGDEGAPPATDEMVDVVEDSPEPDTAPEPEPEPEQPDPEEVERQQELERQRQEARREEERRRAEEERRRRMEEATGRFQAEGRGDEAPEGSPEGVAGGTVTDADRADMMQTYHARLLRAIERHWEIPSMIDDAELEQLAGRVRVYVELDDAGHVVNYDFRRKSDHEQFDDSIERVLRQFHHRHGGHQLPLPEQTEIRAEIVSRGLTLTNWETVQR